MLKVIYKVYDNNKIVGVIAKVRDSNTIFIKSLN